MSKYLQSDVGRRFVFRHFSRQIAQHVSRLRVGALSQLEHIQRFGVKSRDHQTANPLRSRGVH